MLNLIIIDCHDLGQHIGAYGWKTVPTPNLDNIAVKGIRFQNSFCTAPQCSPSRAALYTGRYPHANGMMGLTHHPFNWRLNPQEIHLAEYLHDAGYFTSMIGIQHLTAPEAESIRKLGFDSVHLTSDPEKVAERATSFLSSEPQKPFFIKIGYEHPHRDPAGRYNQAEPHRELGVEIPPYLPQSSESKEELAALQGVIYQMDLSVGKIWRALSESGLLESTWVIFTTDHGLAMPMAKCTLYDPGILTALLMYAQPLNLVGGKVFQELISNVDLVPTILDLLGIDQPVNLQGRSFADLLRHQPYSQRAEIYAEKTFHTAYEPQRAIRTSHYKLIWNAEAGIVNVPGDTMRSPIYPQMIDKIVEERPHFELFNLRVDPHEQNNLIGHPDYVNVFNDLRHRLSTWMVETGDPLVNGPVSSPFFQDGIQLLNQ